MALFDAALGAMDDAGDGDLVFANFVDFDTLFGHRRDIAGYAAALEAFDRRLPEALARLRPGDLLLLTADHGCDPSWRGTDHTRERVPVFGIAPRAAGRRCRPARRPLPTSARPSPSISASRPAGTANPSIGRSPAMPELPEVETVRRGLQPVMEGARIARVECGGRICAFRFPTDFAEAPDGPDGSSSLGRRAKYLTAEIEGGPLLICHLGMSGSFRIEAERRLDRPGRVPSRAVEGGGARPCRVPPSPRRAATCRRIVFNDPRRFGFMLFAERGAGEHPMLAGLGVEPTGNTLDGRLLARSACAAGRRRSRPRCSTSG